jgi:pimeloyl-ACP methyl ester carboxylesterase
MQDWLRNMALGASLQALVECNRTLARTDLRAELAGIDVPVLLIAGTNDASAPLALTACPSADLLPQARLKIYEGAPHGMFVTHMAEVNRDLLEFAASIGHNRRQS